MVVGAGAVGARVVSTLLAGAAVESVTVVARKPGRAAAALDGLADRVEVVGPPPLPVPAGTDVVVAATPSGGVALAAAAIEAGAHAVVACDDAHDVAGALDLDALARAAGRCVVVGAVMAPGLSCVLAGFGAGRLGRVDEIHVASLGTGGPSCARHHHAAFTGVSTDWYDDGWRRHPAGSGRELVWFPEPVGGADCYRARLADPRLLVPAFPGVRRVTARLAATRRDRLTAALPMLRPPHPEGTVGAVRVELRGRSEKAADAVVLGSVGTPAVTAGVVAAVAAEWSAAGRLARSGAGGLAALVAEPGRFLRDVAGHGVAFSLFEGVSPGGAGAGL